MKDIFEKLKGMDKSQLKSAVKQAREFVKTPQGKEFAEKIKNGSAGEQLQKDNIMKEIGKNPELAKMISDIFNAEG